MIQMKRDFNSVQLGKYLYSYTRIYGWNFKKEYFSKYSEFKYLKNTNIFLKTSQA